MSNVRPRVNRMCRMRNVAHTTEVHRSAAAGGSSLLQLLEQQPRRIGVGRPSAGGRRTVLSCQGFLQRLRGLPVLRRPAHRRLGSNSTHRPNDGVCSTAVPSLTQTTKACSTRAGVRSVSPRTGVSLHVRCIGAFGHAVQSTFMALGRVVLSSVRPNPSVKRTHNGGARWLASATSAAPSCAAYLKR